MKRALMLILALCLAALATDNAVTAPQSTAGRKPQATSLGTEEIAIPQMLSYQGKLTDTLGQPVPNGSYQLTFRLYSQPTGGSAFWSETQTIMVKSGLFSALLGAVTPITSLPDAGALYVSLQVAVDPELSPRLRIVSAAYAYKADTANYAASATPAGGAHGDLHGSYPSPTVDGLQGRAVSGTAPSSGQVLKWSGSDWAPAADDAGGPPSGPAGGDLTGTYPNPTIAANAVGSAEVTNGSLSGVDVSMPCTLSLGTTGTALRVNVPSAGRGIHVYRQSTGSTNSAILGQTTTGSGAGVQGEATGDDGASVGLYGRTTPGARPGVYGYNAASVVLAPNVAAGVAGYSAAGPAFYVDSTGTYGLQIRRSGSGGIRIDTVGGNGLGIARPGQDGIHVTNAPDDGAEAAYCNYGFYAHDAVYTGVIGGGKYGGALYTNTEANGVGLLVDAYNQNASDTAILAHGKGLATGGWYTGFSDGEAPCVVSDQRTTVASGTARIAKGEATTAFPALFSAHLKPGAPVRVSLTPHGDPAGVLCVAASDAAGFSVRLKQVPGWDGSEDVEFDWVAFGTLDDPQTNPADPTPAEAFKHRIPPAGTSDNKDQR